MSKRRIVIATAVVVVLAMSMALLVACGGDESTKVKYDTEFYPDNFVAVDYSAMQEVSGKDAFDLLCKVYDTWTKDKGYKRTQVFTFQARVGGESGLLAGFQNAQDVYKIDGDKLYRRMVKIQGGSFADKLNELTRFYYDGAKAKKVVFNDKSKKIIPGDAKNENGMFYVAEDKPMTDYNEDVTDNLKTYTSHMTTYAWRDKANLVDNGFKVYKADDGTLRFTIEINCAEDMMKGAHHEAWKEFESSTGADTDSIKMRANTTIDFVVGDVDGVQKILAWRRTELYSGGKAGMDLINAKQTSVETFSYDKADYTITPEDLA